MRGATTENFSLSRHSSLPFAENYLSQVNNYRGFSQRSSAFLGDYHDQLKPGHDT
jgi:hypothetical protein